jgi:hypothetical protein
MQPQYNATVFLPPDEQTPIQTINDRLQECLKNCNPDRVGVNDWPGHDDPARTDDVFTAYWGSWQLHVTLSTREWIAEEAQELAADHNHEPPYDVIAKCTQRVELWSGEINDPNMDHFNDYVCVLGAIEHSFEGAIVFDSGELI